MSQSSFVPKPLLTPVSMPPELAEAGHNPKSGAKKQRHPGMCELSWDQLGSKFLLSPPDLEGIYTLATTGPGYLSLYSNQPPAVDLAIDTGLDLG